MRARLERFRRLPAVAGSETVMPDARFKYSTTPTSMLVSGSDRERRET
jgi:hypothetical protein